MKPRDKASDIFNKGEPIFSKKVGFAQAFPTIASVDVMIEIDGHGVRGMKEVTRRDATNLSEFIDCRNPRCYGGGFSIGGILRAMDSKKETHHKGHALCQGHEGNRRKRGLQCMTMFDYTVDIVYR